jgi:hypothetical protein
MRGKILLASAVGALLAVGAWTSSAYAQNNPHYCCWQAKATGTKSIKATKPAGTLDDQTANGNFEKCKFKAICNPCNKNGSGTPPQANLHYCMWQCKGPKVAVPYTVTDTNFNSGDIETKKLKWILNECTKS